MTNPAVSRTCDFCSDFSSIDKTTNKESIKNLPLEDRPREKLFLRGVEALTDAELLAILLRTGTARKSALEIAKELTADGGLYRRLAGVRDLNELMQIKGMGQAKAATVLAALEIGRRIASARPLDKIRFGCPQDGAAFLMPRLRYATKEQFLVILLNSKNKVIGTELVSEVPAADLDREYTVQEHDSLSRIAKRELGSYNRWMDIYNSNLDKIKNADVIPAGLNIVIPGKSYINPNGKAADYGTYQFIQSIENQYNETLKTVLGTTPYELTVNDPATGNRIIRNAETNLGDLTADAYRAELGADIGLSNGGGIRSVIKPGNITYNDTLAVFPYGNMGCVIEATGQQIKDALEMASRNCPEESGGFLQVSGLTYTIDTSVKSGVQTDDKGNFTGVSGAYRVMDIKVGGELLDLNKTYTVASHNYMLKQGGDGMTMFKGCNVIRDEVMVDVDILSSYIRRMGGSVTSEYANPGGQGRITIR